MSICLVEKKPYELYGAEGVSIVDDVLTMTWGAEKYDRFGCHPGITQLLVNKSSGPFNFSFSDYPVTESTIFTINGLPPIIQSIQILVI